MTVQEIHNYIWVNVLYKMSKLESDESCADGIVRLKKPHEFSLVNAKCDAVAELRKRGDITEDAYHLLGESDCVLCAIYKSCVDCPLCKIGGTCFGSSIYKHACEGDIDSIKAILNIDVLSGSNILAENVGILEASE